MTTRGEKKENTKAVIRREAHKLFLRHGYEETTTRQIANAANVAIGTVFSHFPDKHSLLQHILHEEVEAVLIQANAQLSQSSGAFEALQHYAQALFSYYRSQWDLSIVLLKEAVNAGGDLSAQMNRFVLELAGRLVQDFPDSDEATRYEVARTMMAQYLLVLVEGLGNRESTLTDWLETLQKQNDLLRRVFATRSSGIE